MKNPWLGIPLEDYESHMALPQVGQSQLLSRLLGEAIDRHSPSSIALLGCAGGNGLERIPSTVERVVGIDINQHFLDQAADRYKAQIRHLELIAGDLAVDRFRFDPVDLVFAGLIFEYVQASQLLGQVASMLKQGGRLVSVVQLPSAIDEVTPSPFTTLNRLSSVLHVVPVNDLKALAMATGFQLETEQVASATGGKTFQVSTFLSMNAPTDSAHLQA